MCLAYPGTKWFMGRNELKRLMASTYVTFQKVMRFHNLPKSCYKLNGQYNYIEFVNGSRIDLLDLKYLPSDPLYERFGSLEFTGGFIEEAGEVHFGAFDTLKSRINRHFNKELNIHAFIFLSCNPKKNWLYTVFYKRWKNKTLPDNYCFIQSLYFDNPYTASSYKASLSQLSDPSKKQRLMFGNWEYDDDPNSIFEYDAIIDMFSNEFILESDERYISSDLAMKGRDKFVVSSWKGLVCEFPIVQSISDGKSIEQALKLTSKKCHVPRSHVVADSDGMGNYLESYMEGIKTFHGGGKAVNSETFANLRSECYFKLAEMVNQRRIRVKTGDPGVREQIVNELSMIKSLDIDDTEKKQRIMKKDDIKENLAGSPDFADTLMMRMVFELEAKAIMGFI